MIKITHAIISCAEWRGEMGIGKPLWEIPYGDDMDLEHETLAGLLAMVTKDLDFMENLGGVRADTLWPDGKWHNEVDESEPWRWCTAWSLPDKDGRVYCVDLWLVGPGCDGKPPAPRQWAVDRNPDGSFNLAGTDIVISDQEANVVALVPQAAQENLLLITAAPDLLAVLRRIAGGEYLGSVLMDEARSAITRATKGTP